MGVSVGEPPVVVAASEVRSQPGWRIEGGCGDRSRYGPHRDLDDCHGQGRGKIVVANL